MNIAMNHTLCDACETVAHCSKNGCIPLQQAHASGQLSAAQSVAHHAAGEFPISGANLKSHSISFCNADGVIGSLDFNGPALVFTGNAEESAKVFMEFVVQQFASRLAEEREHGKNEA